MKILLLDNYDSFTYNIVHILRSLGTDFDVKRNDKITLEEVNEYSHLIFSPGPGIPSEANLMPSIISTYKGDLPMLGICLGHQAIAESNGVNLINLEEVYHGVKNEISIDNKHPLFLGLPEKISVGRYHSWTIDSNSIESKNVIATDENDQVMALAYEKSKQYGVQFHPESIMTEGGAQIIENFLKIVQ